jgi:hypothetical protein
MDSTFAQMIIKQNLDWNASTAIKTLQVNMSQLMKEDITNSALYATNVESP